MVVASIDLLNGKVVQLRQGREKVLERDDPFELLKDFDRYGPTAVIDLDAALGRGSNLSLIKQLVRSGECRVGGGIRNVETAVELVAAGARKIIIGSKAFEQDRVNRGFLEELAGVVGRQRIIVAIDALNEEIVTQGWQHRTGLKLTSILAELAEFTSELLFTCVEREGTMTGIDMNLVEKLRAATENQVTVAGGVTTIDEIRKLSRLGLDVQLGMSLYTGRINLAQAFIETLNWKSELLPTITQNSAGQVLMLGHSNRESLDKTFATGSMHYYSRSRGRLWLKGETSGHTQTVVRLRADCDRDTILATVEQQGPACHLGTDSCFGDHRFDLNGLYDLVKARLDNPQPTSYTARLHPGLLRRKLLEEIQELANAGTMEEIVHETADVLYFLTVLLARKGIKIGQVFGELASRRKESI